MRSYPRSGRWLRGEEIEVVVLEALERLDGAASVDVERETRETMLRLGLPAEGAPLRERVDLGREQRQVFGQVAVFCHPSCFDPRPDLPPQRLPAPAR